MTLKVASAGAAPRGWRPWLAPALVGSLMLNLLLAGAIAGSFLVRPHGPHGLSPPIERGLINFIRSLPPDRAKVLLVPFETIRPELRAQRRDVKERRKEALDAFAAERLDGEALKAALTKAGEAETRLQALISKTFVDTASLLSPAERQSYRQWRERHEAEHPGPPDRR